MRAKPIFFASERPDNEIILNSKREQFEHYCASKRISDQLTVVFEGFFLHPMSVVGNFKPWLIHAHSNLKNIPNDDEIEVKQICIKYSNDRKYTKLFKGAIIDFWVLTDTTNIYRKSIR